MLTIPHRQLDNLENKVITVKDKGRIGKQVIHVLTIYHEDSKGYHLLVVNIYYLSLGWNAGPSGDGQ